MMIDDEVLFMLDMEYICENYFESKVKPKHLRSFTETTPEGNVIEGYISVKPNKYLGSCLIITVNGEETNQFIQSMPKIHYFEDERDISNEVTTLCYEKLDGTCLILYPLQNKNGEVIEIIPKTRGRAVADSHFITLFKKVDQKPIQDYYKENNGILIFEMYGILNQHEIIHYNVGIDIRLIAIFDNDKFNNNPIEAEIYGFKKPDLVFKLTHQHPDWILKSTSDKFKQYLKRDIWTFPTNIDAVDGIQKLLEDLNKEYITYNGIRAIEGVVINTYNERGYPKWLKCKPKDIENEHRSQNGIPRSSITKEVLKYFDEYGADVREIYLQDKNHHTEYIERMLSEEYNEEYIAKSRKKIERIFMQIWDSRIPPISLFNLADKLIEENPDKSIQDLMRIFAVEYPSKKNQARTLYTTLNHKLKKNKGSN